MKDEALRLALEALGHFEKAGLATLKTIDAITAIKQALEQPEPEPVAWIDHRIHGFPDCFVMQPEPPHTSPVYTSPPKREWQGLTDDEIKQIEETTTCTGNESWLRNLTRNIEAKLKEKNNG